ncbi:hypothetical protein LZD49_04765 [Dyadobacter sp. CY261]|uniref:hypothetical protein n=1 Tax=Dyadobacter sp. CY261 TaxID=2907203 RepID=UPI001F1B12D7|nr:hypothetical protein [Dyadobacter sp. CY261]MCF0069772.1 hypothetical protein [Dyadobacter sp. CY261]
MDRNFLNLTEKQKDQPIYRIISVGRLFELFSNRQNVLVKPKLWEDPFENFMMNSTGELKDGRLFSIGFREHFFGQCWTRTKESDAMWRIYSYKKEGARISTTPRKLLKALYDSGGQFRDISCFIGKVNYYTTTRLQTLLQSNGPSWMTDSTGVGQAQTLLFKRYPFKHENEVRIIYNSQGKVNGDKFSFPIDPFKLIDDIVFDPRMEYKEFSNYKSQIKALGFSRRIVKSNLYKAPNLKFSFT